MGWRERGIRAAPTGNDLPSQATATPREPGDGPTHLLLLCSLMSCQDLQKLNPARPTGHRNPLMHPCRSGQDGKGQRSVCRFKKDVFLHRHLPPVTHTHTQLPPRVKSVTGPHKLRAKLPRCPAPLPSTPVPTPALLQHAFHLPLKP